jgi:hypothetical protein
MAQTLIALSPDELRAMVRDAVAEAMAGDKPASTKRYMDAKEIAAHFGVSRATVSNWTAKEGCPHLLRGKVLRFELAAVEAWFRGREPSLRRVK